jgi:CheY-like chemotaxis protein
MAKPEGSGTLRTMPVRCLIVDDNRDFLRAARALLERQGISVVGLAMTGAQAQRSVSELSPDIVLIDIDLGEESGFQVAGQLAARLDARLDARPDAAKQPVLVLISAYSADDFEDMIADTPAVSFLPKSDLSGTAIRAILTRVHTTHTTHSTQNPQRDSR